jgi:transposase
MGKRTTRVFTEVAGLDLGDKYSRLCVVDRETGETIEESRLPTTPRALERRFSSCAPMRIAIEVGTHSPWVSRLLEKHGHEVLVANPRKVRLISGNKKKTDKVDAELLARLARVDPKLLSPIQHRGESAQAALAVVRSRHELVGARTALVAHVRGSCKAVGVRLPTWSPDVFAKRAMEVIPEVLRPALVPVLEIVATLTLQIKRFDSRVEELGEQTFPETKLLRQVKGVGPITSLAYVLVLEDAERFKDSRSVGAYLGLVPRKDETGESDPQLRITKEGDELLRSLLVNAAQYILGPFGEDCDLKRHGLKIAARGGKNAKKRAVVAVARKLAVLLHVLWRKQATYDALHNTKRPANRKAA